MSARQSRIQAGISATTSTLDTLAAASRVNLPAVLADDWQPGTLSLAIAADIETSLLTVAVEWEVSNDGTTWFIAKESNNPAATVLGTGTAGADTPILRAISAPPAVDGWARCRAVLVTAGATGAAADTYICSYSYLRDGSWY